LFTNVKIDKKQKLSLHSVLFSFKQQGLNYSNLIHEESMI